MAERFLIDRGLVFTPDVEFKQNVTVDKNLAIEGIPNVSESIANAKTLPRPGGSDTQVQFNDKGSLAGNPNFTFNPATNLLNLKGDITGSTIISAATGSFDLIDGGSF
jgi:hypothetical protein